MRLRPTQLRNEGSDREGPWYTEGMVTKALKNILDRIETWPENAQAEAAETLQAIEEKLVTPHVMTDEDREALERSAEDVRRGRFAADRAVQELFGRYRRT